MTTESETAETPASTPAPAATPTPETPAPAAQPTPETPASPTPEAKLESAATPNEFKVPDEYKDEPWLDKVKTQDDLWKQLKNAQALIGKKSVAPDFETMTPEQMEEHFAAQRADVDKTAYKFDEATPEDLKGQYAEMLHKYALPPKVANSMIGEFNKIQNAAFADAFTQEGMDKELEASFGKDFKQTAGVVAREVKEILSAEDNKLLDEAIPNQFLGLFYRYGAALHKKYGASETGAAASGGQSGAPAQDINKVRTELRAKIADITNRPHTAADKQALVDQLDATYRK